ncbi:MAG TPA: ABC transporter permease [Acidobacteriaceae bacterium]|jgi:predicted permease|nr:ABC transporter permease [Acidobacteriaceae bacterium]
MLADLIYAWRQLRKSPGFAVTATLTLALGIGATTAIFTMFDQVLLQVLPVQKPQELVRFEWTGSFSGSASSFGGGSRNYFSYPMYKDLRDRNQVFSGMLAADRTSLGLSWHNQAKDVRAELVSGNYFQVLGLKPAVGQLFTSADETANNANPVAVLSYDEWRTQFAADRGVIGQAVAINGHPFTIVGVAPEDFQTAIGGYRPALFVPVTMVDTAIPWMTQRHNFDNRQSLWLTLVARRKPGISMAQAQAAMVPLWRALRASELPLYKEKTAKFVERYVNGSKFFVKDDSMGFSPGRMDLKTPLVILLSMAGLLVAMCALNVATLLLLRSTARVKEMAMRYALGAKSSRIVRQLLLEGGLLGLVGGVAGVALSPVLAQILVRLLTSAEPGKEPYSASLDGRVLLFTLGLSVVVSVLFSIAPALHFLRPDLAGSLRQSTGTASKASQSFRKLAVGVQIGLSVLLLGGAGLFVRTLNNLRDVPVGWNTARVATFELDPTESGYGEARTSQIVQRAVATLRALPGVAAASATTDPELSGDSNTDGYKVQGHKFTENEENGFESPWVMPGYFATLQQPLLAGRGFTDGDKTGAQLVAVVNLEFAKRFYGSATNALGRLIGDGDKPDTTIVGVVGNTKHQDLRTDIGAAVYRPYLQMQHPTGVVMYLRTMGASDAMEPEIEKTIHQLDPTLVVAGLRTMEAQVDISASNERSLAILAAAFAVLAAILAAVGLYGVLAYSTQSRTREIGVRLALGSPRGAVVALVVREMAWIAGGAALVGLPATVGLAHFFQSQLYGVSTWDPVTLAGALLLTAVMVALASALPAHRATRVDPMEALRVE